jgi:hypothetical protein
VDGACAAISGEIAADWATTSWVADDSGYPYSSVGYDICTQGVSQAEENRGAADVTCAATAQVYTVAGALATTDYTLTAAASIYAKFEGSTADASALATFADTSPVDGRLVRLADVAVDSATTPLVEDIGRTDTDPSSVWPCEDPAVDCYGDTGGGGWALATAGAVVVWDFQYVIE